MDEQKLDVTAQQPDAALHAQTEEITNEALPEALLEQQAAQAELSQAIEASAEELQPEQAEQTTQPERVTVVDIRFRNNAKTYFFDPGELRPVSGDHVIIETARGDEYGICAGACHEVKASEIVPPLRKVLRMATAQDERVNRDNQEKEKRAFEVCQQKIADHKLEMQLVSAEVAFDGSKILWGVLPPKLGFQYMQLERYGFLVLILLLMTGALGYILYPLIQFSVNTVFSLVVLS